MSNNSEALNKGFEKAKRIIYERVVKSLAHDADLLAMKAHDTYKCGSFTGNTWTGTAVGVYANGSLVYYVTTRMIANMPSIRHKKITAGEYLYLKPAYDGRNRGFKGTIDTDKGVSEEDAISFLKSRVPSSKYSITVVNGSEYASYLEREKGNDILIGTYFYAHGLRAMDLIRN